MDDTEDRLQRFERRMARVGWLDLRANELRDQADRIDRELAKPLHERPLEDESQLRLEAQLHRKEAASLSQAANDLHKRLYPPVPDIASQMADRRERGERDRER